MVTQLSWSLPKQTESYFWQRKLGVCWLAADTMHSDEPIICSSTISLSASTYLDTCEQVNNETFLTVQHQPHYIAAGISCQSEVQT